MAIPTASLFAPAIAMGTHAAYVLSELLLNPGSIFSLLSLGCALIVAVAFLLMRGKSRKRHSVKVLARALFPRWLWRNASMRADIGFFLLNTIVTASLIGWALFSFGAISKAVARMLNLTFGAAPALHISPFWREAVLTLALFLTYDFALWVDHYFKHKIPMRWEFHRVHHTAEVLSPFTTFRMHPVDSLIFYNIITLALGVVQGIGLHVLGGTAHQAALSGTNIIQVAFIFATIHLQHSHIDIRFRGWLGKLIFSPAHHQIHHSTKQEHFDSNLGSCLAVWDWMFGTLILPDGTGDRLTFGADTDGDRYTPHSMAGSLVWPFIRALRILRPRPAEASPVLATSK